MKTNKYKTLIPLFGIFYVIIKFYEMIKYKKYDMDIIWEGDVILYFTSMIFQIIPFILLALIFK